MPLGPALAAPDLEAITIRKIRRKLLPFLFLLFFVAYLDRINIGFAALTMNRDLGITAQQFGLLAGIFFVGYFFFEIPSNLLLHRLGARVWIARILVSWGMVAVLTGFVRSVVHLYALRFLLGVAEAGFFPGIILYLTYWFPQREQARAVAFFMAAIPIGNILGASISGLLLDHAHWAGLNSWRWLLVIEGIPAILAGVLTYALLPNGPQEANFLSADEKSWLCDYLARERQQTSAEHMTAVQGLRHGRVWHLAAVYFTMIVASYSMTFWMPQAIQSLASGRSNTAIGLFVMIPHLVGLLAMIFISRNSDRTLERRYHAAIPEVIGAVSLIALSARGRISLAIAVVLWALLAAGIYSAYGPFWSFPRQFLSGISAASAIALINSFGNLGGFAGPYAIGTISRRTGSLNAGLACAGASLLLSAVLVLLLKERARLSRAL
ncbi:MAG TPA: MFS transporter [Terriglobales bacterium]|nr:MFS transporter [Terriglobales bacterium]